MAADSALAGHVARPGDVGGPDTLTVLVESFSREARCEGQRQALDASAIVRELNEPLLARMLGRDDVAQLFDWLRGLSFMQLGENGIRPHDLVREVLLQDMPTRAPQRYEAYANAVIAWTIEKIIAWPAITWNQAAQMIADGMYALRGLPMIARIARAGSTRSLYFDQARDGDWPTLHDMARRHEGEASARWFSFWQQHQPQSVYVVRGTDGAARGFFVKLDMESLPAEQRDADPLTQRVWRFLSDELRLHPGDHVPFIRHWVTHDNALTGSPEKAQILLAIHAYNLVARQLRATAQVEHDTPMRTGIADALGAQAIGRHSIEVGESKQQVYCIDWQRERPARYYGRFFQRMLTIQRHLDGDTPVHAESPGQPLDEQAFKRETWRALKHFRSDKHLATNQLMDAAFVASSHGNAAAVGSRVAALRNCIRQGVAVLDKTQDQRRWGRVLHRMYLEPAANQHEAAAALNLSYSTFRRRLRAARDALADQLWQWEQQAR